MPPESIFPGTCVESVPKGDNRILGVDTSITAFVGRTIDGPINEPMIINDFCQFASVFGGLHDNYSLGYAVRDFFLNGGNKAIIVRLLNDENYLRDSDYIGSEDKRTGIYALEKVDLFNLLCIPPDKRDGDTSSVVYQKALEYCVKRRAMLIVDPPSSWGKDKENSVTAAKEGLDALGLSGNAARNAALFFPRAIECGPDGQPDIVVPSGIIAGVISRIDRTKGVWKAPAGLDATLNGIQGLQVDLTDTDNDLLNPLGINCLRTFPIYGSVVWGARTLRGADQLGDEYKYIPVRRTALFLEESLFRGLQWVTFEPNDESLWEQIRSNVGAFMHSLFVQGAFQGNTPQEAYFVKCDEDTMTQDDMLKGLVNIIVGFAPLKPAEFVVIEIQQLAGKTKAN